MKTRIVLLAALAAFTVVAQETRSANRLTNDHYFDFERVSSPQISPDGARIVYTRQQANRIEDRWDSSLWIMNTDGSQHRLGSNPRWSSTASAFCTLPTANRVARRSSCAGWIATGRPRR
jgi:dipeptidyl aminopeptidase/acylaminoacyl peptidase